MSALIDEQDGLLHRSQASKAGLSRATLRWRTERGLWQMVLPRVYATFTGILSARQRLRAVTLYAGPDAQITGAAALRVHGQRHLPVDGCVQVLVPHPRRLPDAAWARPVRTRRLDRRGRVVDGLPLASIPRAVLDAARGCRSERQVHAMMADAVQNRLCTIDQLRRELADGPRQHSALPRRVLRELVADVRSAPEAEARELFAGSEVLPPMLWNPCLSTNGGQRLPSPDGWISEVDLGIEIDSPQHRTTADGWERTLKRHTELARHGATVLHFTPAELRDNPAHVLLTVERAYVDRLRRGVRGSLGASARR